tara:strand:- start:410 stop:796 length:387 start_codon:yes stop_codon:yes gene_type:complete
MSMQDDVKTFLIKFELMYRGKPRKLSPELHQTRVEHIHEEACEYMMANNLEDKFDALIDLVYVAIGTALLHGLDFEEGWRRVHQANMRKVRDKSTRVKSGIKKPEGWQKPYLKDLTGDEEDKNGSKNL